MESVADRFKVDVCNYFSLEVLESAGIYQPDQQQIDDVAEAIRKVILLTNKQSIMGKILGRDGQNSED